MTPVGTAAQLGRFWAAAATPTPTAIVGGGRWGRVWLSVLVSARGRCDGIVMVAHSDPGNLRAWIDSQPQFRGVVVAASLKEALAVLPGARAAIISSRPRDHVRDGLEALKHGLHILVEKPLSDRASAGEVLVREAQRLQRIIVVGTEFAFLPCLHECAEQLELRHASAKTMHLTWQDPVDETRHGAVKTRHDEIGLLTDLLPHAVSIFQIFAPEAKFRLVSAHQSYGGEGEHLQLSDQTGRLYDLAGSRAGNRRQRLLQIGSGTTYASVDFSSEAPDVVIGGETLPASPASTAMPSTLRLELGAFLLKIIGGDKVSSTLIAAQKLLRLQRDLENILR